MIVSDARSSSSSGCRDESAQCGSFADRCWDTSDSWLQRNCKATCRLCHSTTASRSSSCESHSLSIHPLSSQQHPLLSDPFKLQCSKNPTNLQAPSAIAEPPYMTRAKADSNPHCRVVVAVLEVE